MIDGSQHHPRRWDPCSWARRSCAMEWLCWDWPGTAATVTTPPAAQGFVNQVCLTEDPPCRRMTGWVTATWRRVAVGMVCTRAEPWGGTWPQSLPQ